VLAVQQRLVVLLPQDWNERRDRGLCFAELGIDDAAVRDLRLYVQNCSNAEDLAAICERLEGLGRRPGPMRLH
jgi:regulator of sirC expression with transglutaminase-like and TPR domain